MCNHHACFHDDAGSQTPGTTPATAEARGPGQENEKPRPLTGREPLSPVVDLTAQMPPPSNTANDMDLLNFPVDNLSFINFPGEYGPQDPRIPQNSHPAPSLPDTLSWDETAMPSGHIKPSLGRGAVAPSQATSTTSSVRAKYLKPFGGQGLNTLAPPSQTSSGKTGPATPTQTPGPKEGSFLLVGQDHRGTPHSEGDTQAEPRAGFMPESVTREAFKNLSDAVGGHEQRLDRLETASFSANSHDECHEKHDHMDLRLTDIESRMEEAEKANNEHATMLARLNDKKDDDATLSVASFSTATSRPTHSQELYSQLQSLQAQVNSLQSAVPTFTHPWEIEVVFLPFPLKKVWQEITHFKHESAPTGDDWTQLPSTYSTGLRRSQSPFPGDWAPKDHDAEWLLPRACSDKSMIDKRLRSRGLIRNVSVKGSDARSVFVAFQSVFGETWKEMSMPTLPQTPDPRFSQFLGLQSPWIPLRKIHKDSRLRFLTPAEMLNPTLWDVQFLNSVMMRSSEPRLFITHPDAYLQDLEAYEDGWSWQRVRELTRVYPESGSQEVPEGDAKEDYWLWNEQLDEPPEVHTSLSQRNERSGASTSSTSSISQQRMAAVSLRSSSPVIAAPGQALMLRERRGSRPPQIRTASVPPGAPGHPSPALSRRRVVSYGQSRLSSPHIRGTSQFAISKSRRRTRSPSYARFTPRWTASPSPMPTGLTDRHHVRGTTPFAYATPHSNAPLQDLRAVRAGSAAPIPAEYMPDMAHDMDELYEIEIYESDSDVSYQDEGDEEDEDMVTHPHLALGGDSQQQPRQLPEDEPWPGIEDQQGSDGENIDPQNVDFDARSEASSQPSEHPSTQSAWPDELSGQGGFHIHEDD